MLNYELDIPILDKFFDQRKNKQEGLFIFVFCDDFRLRLFCFAKMSGTMWQVHYSVTFSIASELRSLKLKSCH